MRITGGAQKGRKLAPVGALTLRPSSDMLRERLFAILHSQGVDFTDSVVLDVFAGSGSLGLEAVSRGARQAVFIEQNAKACALIARNIALCKAEEVCTILRRDATILRQRPKDFLPANVVFLDPPYAQGGWHRALERLAKHEWLADKAFCVVEVGEKRPKEEPEGFLALEWRKFGTTQLGFLIHNYSK